MAVDPWDGVTESGSGTPIRDLAAVFLKLGTTAFGGPAAHIAMMEDEVVRRRKWLSRQEFLDYLAASHMIPGPNSTELAIHIGHARAGWLGLLVAGLCFILPAVLIVGAIAWGYVRYGSLPAVAGILYGVKPVVLAVVLQALWGLGGDALKSRFLAWLAAGAGVAAVLGVDELLILGGSAAAAAGGHLMNTHGRMRSTLPIPPVMTSEHSTEGAVASLAAAGAIAATVPFSLWSLFAVFFKVGALLFGSGYVLLAFIRSDLVQRLGWLTEQQLLDAVAVGQVTPGPVFTTATFIGFILGGPTAALVATVAIFLPAFFFVAVSSPLIPRLRRSALAGSVLDGVVVASLALMAVVTWHLAQAALIDPFALGLAGIAAFLLIRYRVNSAWLILAAGALGFFLRG